MPSPVLESFGLYNRCCRPWKRSEICLLEPVQAPSWWVSLSPWHIKVWTRKAEEHVMRVFAGLAYPSWAAHGTVRPAQIAFYRECVISCINERLSSSFFSRYCKSQRSHGRADADEKMWVLALSGEYQKDRVLLGEVNISCSHWGCRDPQLKCQITISQLDVATERRSPFNVLEAHPDVSALSKSGESCDRETARKPSISVPLAAVSKNLPVASLCQQLGRTNHIVYTQLRPNEKKPKVTHMSETRLTLLAHVRINRCRKWS